MLPWLSLVSLGQVIAITMCLPAFGLSQISMVGEIDLSGVVIWTLERFGLAWNVVRIAGARQLRRIRVQAE